MDLEKKDERSAEERIEHMRDYIKRLRATEHSGMDEIKSVCIRALESRIKNIIDEYDDLTKTRPEPEAELIFD